MAPASGIMGIVNITPDSFFDGGRHYENAAAHAGKLLEDGADIVDLGAESTRPYSVAISPSEEWMRLKPVLAAIKTERPEAIISVDTRNAATAQKSLELGADIVNDVSGGRHDPAMPEILAEYKPGYVLMHSGGTPETMQVKPHYDDVVADICDFFESSLKKLMAMGLPEANIALDPGIGFGKTLAHNLEILRHLGDFMAFGRPILIGLSMKSIFGELLNLPLEQRGMATAVASALLAAKGAQWHRVHDVQGVRLALKLAAAL